MKATLDHVGIAVTDLQAALAFYHDALGLDIEPGEEVATQRVRAHFVPVGAASLELLEATAPDSPVAKFVDKRDPGLHHITLLVDDLAAALGQLQARGVRLVDEQPRPGAEGALVAFIHPSSAHGVLVELKEAVATRTARVASPSSLPVANRSLSHDTKDAKEQVVEKGVRIGIIGGSGLYEMAELTDREEKAIATPFGEPSGPYVIGTLRGRRVAFLARHGVGHKLLPSEINFRANIYGFKVLGVEHLFSASAVGSLKEQYKPLDI